MSGQPALDPPLAQESLAPVRRLELVIAQMRWAVGTSGILGLLLLAGALVILLAGWHEQRSFEVQPSVQAAADPGLQAVLPAASAPVPAAARLPAMSQIPVLLERLERTAIAEGVGWSKADYRLIEASAERPAALEVRCALQAQYPALRRFVGTILRDMPTLTFRELSFSRAATTEQNVDAKVTVVVYLDSTASPAAGSAVGLVAAGANR